MKLNKLAYVLTAGVALLATASCSDIEDAYSELNLARALRPTDVTVKVVDKVNSKVSAYFVTEPDQIVYDYYVNADTTDTTNYTKDVSYTYNCPSAGAEHSTITQTHKNLRSESRYKLIVSSTYKSKASVPVEVFFETDAEQILNELTDDNLTATSATVSWDPSCEVTKIVVTKSGETIQEITLTDEQKAAGSAVISNLSPESKYTIEIFNGDKKRGHITATTLPDYIAVYAGNNVDIQSAIDEAEDGKTIMLLPAKDGSTSEFTFTGDDGAASTKQIEVSKNVTIACLDTKPVTAKVKFLMHDGCSTLNIRNIKFVGSSSDAFLKIGDATAREVNIENVNVSGYKNFIPNDKDNAGTLQTLNVKNSYFHDMCNSTRFVDMQNSRNNDIRTLNFTQNTFANLASGSDFIRVDYLAAMAGVAINFTNNTVYQVEATSKGLFYVRSNAAGNMDYTCKISNNVFSNCSDKVYFSQDAKSDNHEYSGNWYNSCPSLLVALKTGCTYDASPAGEADPKFADADNGDFTITNETILDKNAGNTEFVKK